MNLLCKSSEHPEWMGGKGPHGNVVASVLCSVMTHGLLVFFRH